jgi:hypothetical protein
LEAGSVPPSLNFPQLDFVEPSSGFHFVTWERVILHLDSLEGGHRQVERHILNMSVEGLDLQSFYKLA